MAITTNCSELLSSDLLVKRSDTGEEEEGQYSDFPWELWDPDNTICEEENYMENPELVQLKLSEGGLSYVAAVISLKVFLHLLTKIYYPAKY